MAGPEAEGSCHVVSPAASFLFRPSLAQRHDGVRRQVDSTPDRQFDSPLLPRRVTQIGFLTTALDSRRVAQEDLKTVGGTGGSNPSSSAKESVSPVPSMATGAKVRLLPGVRAWLPRSCYAGDDPLVARAAQQDRALADPDRAFELDRGWEAGIHCAPETRVRRSSISS